MKLVVVICHYQEDISWVNNLKHDYVIYNKNIANNHLFTHNIENYGFDTIAYINYILENYNNLPDYICFSQDNPFFHCSSFLDKVNNFNFDVNYLALGSTYIRDNQSIVDKTKKYGESLGLNVNLPIKFINSAQCIVSKNLVLKNGLKIYENILNSYPRNTVISETNYLLEYLWPTIFGFNDELNISINNC